MMVGMTTLRLGADDIANLIVGKDGSVAVELTTQGLRTVEALAVKRTAAHGATPGVQVFVAAAPPSDDAGFAAGYRRGYANGRGPGMPPMRA